MKLIQLVITGAFIAVLGFAGSVAAGESAYFTQLDADGDGSLSKEEASVDPVLQSSWADADANQDGKLESAEFSAFEMKAQDTSK